FNLFLRGLTVVTVLTDDMVNRGRCNLGGGAFVCSIGCLAVEVHVQVLHFSEIGIHKPSLGLSVICWLTSFYGLNNIIQTPREKNQAAIVQLFNPDWGNQNFIVLLH